MQKPQINSGTSIYRIYERATRTLPLMNKKQSPQKEQNGRNSKQLKMKIISAYICVLDMHGQNWQT